MRFKKIALIIIVLFLSYTSICSSNNIGHICNSRVGKVTKLCTSSFNETHVQEWNFTWGINYYEDSNAISYDSSGNLYIAGYTNLSITGDYDIFLAKFNTLGEYQWNQTFKGDGDDEIGAIVIDSLDNIYLTGTTTNGMGKYYLLLVKYDNLGHYQWNQTWGGSIDDLWYGIALDSKNDIYVAGSTANFTTSRDICLVKFNTSGHYQWNRTWGGDYNYDIAYDIIIDSSDNIYITGAYQKDSSSVNLFLLKYNSSGDYQWNRSFDSGIVNHLDSGLSVDLDSSDNVYVSGVASADIYTMNSSKMLLFKYNSSGGLLYQRIWGTKGYYIVFDHELDSKGNIYIVGCVNHSDTKNKDFYLTQFNNNSEQQFNYTWGGSKNDIYKSITIDLSDNIYLTGVKNNNEVYLEKYSKIDITPPFIAINSPINGEIFTEDVPTFNLTVTDMNLDILWYSIDDTVIETFTSIAPGINLISINETVWDNLPDGQLEVIFFANDTWGNTNNASINIVKRQQSNGSIAYGNVFIILTIFSVSCLIILSIKKKKILP